MRRAILIPLLTAGCVFPSPEITGLEFSWRFREANTADGEDATRVRSCSGAGVATMQANVLDEEDAERTSMFLFGCDDGFQTEQEFQTEASAAFIELNSGPYRIDLSGFTGGQPVMTASRAIDVGGRGVSVEPFELGLPTIDATIALMGLDACTEGALTLLYTDPVDALPQLEIEDEENPPRDVVYRAALTANTGLGLGGQAFACSPALQTQHIFPTVDAGEYRLDVRSDASTCSFNIVLGPGQAAVTVDLANLPCGA